MAITEQNFAELTKAVQADYDQFCKRAGIDTRPVSMSFVTSRKYAKIFRDHTVWGFVQLGDDDRFRAGDILLSRGCAPARNKARGNIIDGDFSSVKFTGPAYL